MSIGSIKVILNLPAGSRAQAYLSVFSISLIIEMEEKNLIINSKLINHVADEYQTELRSRFSNFIIEFKLRIHQCQLRCYTDYKTDLIKAENCADKCYRPYFSASTAISDLTTEERARFEKCRFNAITELDLAVSTNHQLKQCLNGYRKKLNSLQGDIETIYRGYYEKMLASSI